MPPKDFKAGFKASSLNGRKVTEADAVTPFGYSPAREELERQAENLPVVELPIASLQDNPYQHVARPQLSEEALLELVSSIRENGFYGALLARRKKDAPNSYELAYGHRRKEASRRAGLVTLPVKVIELSDEKMIRIMASENFSRQDLDPLGEANVVGLLETTQNLSARQIAEIIGKGRSWVERRLALYEAPNDIKELVAQKPDAFSLVDLLLGVKEIALREELTQEAMANGLTRKELQDKLARLSPSRPLPPARATLALKEEEEEKEEKEVEPAVAEAGVVAIPEATVQVITAGATSQLPIVEEADYTSEETGSMLVATHVDGEDLASLASSPVKNVTNSPQRGNGEISNNLARDTRDKSAESGVLLARETSGAEVYVETPNTNLEQEWQQALALVEEGLDRLVSLDKYKMPLTTRKRLDSLAGKLAALLQASR